MKYALPAVALMGVLITGCWEQNSSGGESDGSSSSTLSQLTSSDSTSSCSSYPAIDPVVDAQQRALWESQGIVNYRFDYIYEAQSYQPMYSHNRVIVAEDQGVAHYHIDANGSLSGPYENSAITLKSLFGKTIGTISYDSEYGYVTELHSDSAPCGYDGKYSYIISNIVPIDESEITNEQWMLSLYQQMQSVSTTACTSMDQCTAKEYGIKPCGGPAAYLVYNAVDTNETALELLITRYDIDNQAYNAQSNATSDCSVLEAPQVECSAQYSQCLIVTETP